MIAIVALLDTQLETTTARQASNLVLILGTMGLFVLFFVTWLALLNMFPAVQTSAQGISVQFFWFWQVYIPWKDITGLYRWLPGEPIAVVVTEKLTPFHVFYGLVYAGVLKPAFLISARISGYDALVRTIKERTEQRMRY